MDEKGMGWVILFMVLASLAAATLIAGCTEDFEGNGGDTYCCRYETRYTGCGGKGWSDWEKESYSFNINDYKEGWTPQRVCDKYTGSTESCGGGYCIFVEYRNTRLTRGSCS
jgi:hypothetical protein